MGGVPAKVIGSFEELVQRRLRNNASSYEPSRLWDTFFERRHDAARDNIRDI